MVEPSLSQIDLHATTTLDRLGSELAASGVTRQPQRDGSEAWSSDARTRLSAWGPPDISGANDESAVREYAVLLTRSESISDTLSIRVTSLPVQLALWCMMHTRSKRAAVDSPWIEDLIAVVVGRHDCITELRALPSELRAVVADGVGAFAASQACRWVIGRIVVEAQTTPQIIDVVLKRLESAAQLPRS
ncbi:MAG: hypothetical protein P3A28_04265 [Gemmatimonadota bacterium]|nr:hypothetical protein [Gemmatimonadota bacterium]